MIVKVKCDFPQGELLFATKNIQDGGPTAILVHGGNWQNKIISISSLSRNIGEDKSYEISGMSIEFDSACLESPSCGGAKPTHLIECGPIYLAYSKWMELITRIRVLRRPCLHGRADSYEPPTYHEQHRISAMHTPWADREGYVLQRGDRLHDSSFEGIRL